MPTDDAQPATPAGPGEQDASTPQPDAPSAEEQNQAAGLDSLPESWQAEIRSLRSENAERRTKYNELKSQLDGAKSQEDIDKAVETYKSQVVDLERTLAFERHTAGLAPEARELVTGTTDEEIKASADKVRALLAASGAPKKEPDLDASGGPRPRQGRGMSGLDPHALAQAVREANGRRRA